MKTLKFKLYAHKRNRHLKRTINAAGVIYNHCIALHKECGQVLEKLDLSVREWRCPSCQSVNGRDENAAKNIQAVGASTVSLGDVRQASPAITA
ncbi:MAG: zinc ribbon domain-containing protein [Microcoleus anatoxicus]|uniref:zinc ribbon domain-containing protein n=1 Tax=Microcoleus anatoxicus TaxID=2705319 RepID=UPI00366EB136